MSFDSRTGQKVSLAFTWTGQAKTKGSYPVSPFIIEVDGQKLTSKSLTLVVSPQQTSALYLFQTSLSSNQAYVGQSIDLHLDLLMAEQEIQKYERYLGQNYELANRHYNAIELKDDWTKDFHIIPKLVRQAQGASNVYFGSPITSLKIGDFLYRRHRLTFTLEPKQTGIFTIPAMQEPFFKLSFQRGFFGVEAQKDSRPIVANAPALKLDVLETPAQNRPSSFNGQVCEVLEVELIVPDLSAGQEVQLHAPLPIQLKISGSLSSESIRNPTWNAQTELLQQFEVSTQSIQRDDQDHFTLFSEIILRPKRTDLTSIPPIEVSYFDPVKKVYLSAKTKAFPIKVQAVDIEAGLEEKPLALLELQKKKDPIKTIGRVEGLEVSHSLLSHTHTRHWPWVWVSLLSYSPLALVGFYYGLSIFIHRKVKYSEEHRFHASGSLKTIQSATSSSAILEALNKFITHKYHVSDPRLAKLSTEHKSALDRLLSELEAASYAPDGDQKESLRNQSLEMVKRLAKDKT